MKNCTLCDNLSPEGEPTEGVCDACYQDLQCEIANAADEYSKLRMIHRLVRKLGE